MNEELLCQHVVVPSEGVSCILRMYMMTLSIILVTQESKN